MRSHKIFSRLLAIFLFFSSIIPSQPIKAAQTYPYPSGSLVRESKTIYLINGVDKIPFTNFEAFKGLGYSTKNVVGGNLTNYNLAKTYMISSSEIPHPWGSWVLYKGTVYYAREEGLIGVPSMSVLNANGGQAKMIVTANKYDIEIIQNKLAGHPLGQNDSRVFRTPNEKKEIANLPGEKVSIDITNGDKNQNSLDNKTVKKLTPAPPSTASENELYVDKLSPTAGYVGSFVAITGKGFDLSNNVVRFGPFTIGSFPSVDQSKIVFSVPQALSNCNNVACTNVNIKVSGGDYGLTVENSKGISNSNIFTVIEGVGQKFCEYETSPQGYHYEGGNNYPDCGAHLVPDNPSIGLKYPTEGNGNKICEYATPPQGFHYEEGGTYPDCNARLVPDFVSEKKSPDQLPAVCEYPAPPEGFHYEGGSIFPYCGAVLVPDSNTSSGLKLPTDHDVKGVCDYAMPPQGYHYEEMGKYPECSANLVKDTGLFDYLPTEK